VNTSTGNANSGAAVRRFMDDAMVQGNPEAVEELIAHILRRARGMAEALNAPNEARAILRVAHSFADELAATNPRFDRLRFIRAVTAAPA
jgi:DNA-binding phage protein